MRRSHGQLRLQAIDMAETLLKHGDVRVQSLPLLHHVILLQQQLFKLHLHVEVVDQDLLAGVAAVVDQEGHDGLGDRVVHVLLYDVEVGHDQPLYHVRLGLLPQLGVVVDLDHAGH